MAVATFVGISTAAASGTGNITVGLPANLQVGDLLILVAEYGFVNNATVNASSEWDVIFDGAYETGSALKVWAHFYTGTNPSGTLTESVANDVDHTVARMAAYRGVDQSLGALTTATGTFDEVGFYTRLSTLSSGTGTTVTYPAITTRYADERVLLIYATTRDANSTANISVPTNANLTTITERFDNVVNTGGGGGIGLADGVEATRNTNIGTSSATITNSAWGAITLTLRPTANRVLLGETGSFTETLNDANITIPKKLIAETASFSETLEPANILRGRYIFGNLGLFTVSDQLKYRDTFNYSNGTLSTVSSGNWVNRQGAIDVIDGTFAEISSTVSYSEVNTTTYDFHDNQEAEILLTSLRDFDYIGPAVRMTASGCYAIQVDTVNSNDRRLIRISGTTKTVIGTINISVTAGDTLKIRAVGNQISAYKNGVLIETVTDSTYATGQPGIFYDKQNSNNSRGDNFVGYTVGVDSVNLKVGRRFIIESYRDVQLFSDDFTGSAGTLGSNYTQQGDGLVQRNGLGQVVGTIDIGRNVAYPNTVTFNANQYAEITLTELGIGPNVASGVILRLQTNAAVGTEQAYAFRSEVTSGTIPPDKYVISKFDASSTNIVIASSDIVPKVNDRIRAVALNNSLLFYLNDYLILTVQDTLWPTGVPAIYSFGNDWTSDDFVCGNYGGLHLGLAPTITKVSRKITLDTGSFSISGSANILRSRYIFGNLGLFTPIFNDATITKTAGAKTLTAEFGTFTLVENDAFFFRGLNISITAQAYTLTGPPVTLKVGRKLSAESQSYNENLQPANLLRNRRLVADTQTYNENLQPANLLRNRRLVAEQQTYNENLQAANLLGGRRVVADVQTYNENLQPANLLRNRRLVADTRALTLTRNDVTFKYNRVITATVQTYTLDGKVLAFLTLNIVKTDTQNYTLTRNDATLRVSRKVVADVQTYNDTLRDANVLRGRRIVADVQTYNENLQPANLFVARKLLATVQTYNENLQPATLLRSFRLVAESGTFAENLQSANILRNRRLVADTQTYSENLQPANLRVARSLTATTQNYSLTGNALNFVSAGNLIANSRAYTLTTNDANLRIGRRVTGEGARNNYVSNSQAVGAIVGVIGSGGALPTGWGWSPAPIGITREVVGIGVRPNGIPYLDVRISGTNNEASIFYPDLYFITGSSVYSMPGQTWTGNVYIEHLAGSRSGFFISTSRIYIAERNSIPAYQDGSSGNSVTAGVSTVTRTLTSTLATNVAIYVDLAIPAGNSVDFTFRVSGPQLERAAVSTAYIPTTSGFGRRWFETSLQPANLLSGKKLVASASNYSLTRNDATLRVGRRVTGESARSNLLTYSEQFDNSSVWLKQQSSISVNSVAAPNGEFTADTLVEDSSNNFHRITRNTTVSALTAYTLSIYVKDAGRQFAQVRYENGGSTELYAVNINLSTGTYTTATFGTPNIINSSVQSAGDGWWRISLSVVTNNTSFISAVYSQAVSGTNIYTGNGTSGIYIWGAQLEKSSSATTYIPTTTTPVYKWFETSLQPANLLANKKLVADTRSYTLTRNDASLIAGEKLPLDTAQYNLTGGTLAFRRTYVVSATTKAIELSGYVEGGYVEPGYVSTSIQILYGRRVALSSVAYTLTGQLANITTARGLIKVWTGSAWVLKPLKVWTGTAWVTKPIKIWDGTIWRTY